MARARRAATSKTPSSGDGTLTCPECGKTFARPASLGAHRNRAHGVAGASARRTRRRSGTATRRQSVRTRTRTQPTNDGRGRVDRDALLQTIFPNGVPAREEVIRRANAWLDEAERLAGVK